MIQADGLPLSEILDCSIITEVFEEEKVHFGIADEDVYTPAITLWAMISQMLSSKAARSCKAAAGRVVSLWAKIANRVAVCLHRLERSHERHLPSSRCVCGCG